MCKIEILDKELSITVTPKVSKAKNKKTVQPQVLKSYYTIGELWRTNSSDAHTTDHRLKTSSYYLAQGAVNKQLDLYTPPHPTPHHFLVITWWRVGVIIVK